MRDYKIKPWLWVVCIALAVPCGANAAGLGRINVLSSLGQPLNAEIELLSVQKNETVYARFASPDTYQQANSTYNPALAGARITVQQRKNGQMYLHATTSRSVYEPFLELIVELSSQHGRITRQYSALLDPPGYGKAAGEIAPPVASAQEPRAPSTPAVTQAPATPASAAPPAAGPPAAAARAPSRRRPAATPSAAEAPSAAGQYGPIKSGETLGRIARSVKPEGVTLEQTLVGLYRQNPDAFIRKNMNLVKSGKILRVPEASEIAALPQREAVQEVRLQVADFNAFRARLAEKVANAPEEGSVTRGRIATRVADRAAGEEPRDTVRLSRGEPGQAKGKGGPRNAKERMRMLEEEAVARERALAEANDRIEKLEKTIKDMQRLAELKSSGMAAAQQAAEKSKGEQPAGKKAEAPAVVASAPPAPAAAKAPEAAPGPSAAPPAPAPAVAPPPGAVAPAPGAPDAAKAEAPKPAPPAAKAKAPAPRTPEPDFIDTVMNEPAYLAAAIGGVLLLAGLGLWAVRGRRRQGGDEGLVKIAPRFGGEGQAAAGASATRAQARRADMPPTSGGRSERPKPFTTATGTAPAPGAPADDNDLDFGAKGGGATGSAARTLAQERGAPPAPRPAAPKPTEAASTPPRPAQPAPRSTEAAVPQPRRDKPPEPPMPDFGLGTSPGATPVESAPAFNVTDFTLDPLPPVGAEPDIFKTVGATPAGGDKTTDFNLDLKDLNLEPGGQRAPAGPAKDDHWYDVQQKFDLAKAYEEMGDKDGAREILNEVLREGDSEQQAQASKLLGPRG